MACHAGVAFGWGGGLANRSLSRTLPPDQGLVKTKPREPTIRSPVSSSRVNS